VNYITHSQYCCNARKQTKKRLFVQEKQLLENRYREECEQHSKTTKQLKQVLTEVELKKNEQCNHNETLVVQITQYVQKMFASEDGKCIAESNNSLLQRELELAKTMMHEKQTVANDVCQGLKSINEQLIHTLQTERKDFDTRHQHLLAEVENARREAQNAQKMQAGTQKEAEEAAYHAHVVALETDKGLSHLHADLEGLRKTVRDFEVRDSVISGDHERVLLDDMRA
jgi:cobalamin biosynthesis Mg chelatase CobN